MLRCINIFAHRRFFSVASCCRKGGPAFPPLPELKEADLEETFVRGSGPGGQKINKTSVVAQLKHVPTGLTIKCQATRSQAQNRVIARKQLQEKLDILLNGEHSRGAIKTDIKKRKSSSAQKKRNRKYRALNELEEQQKSVNVNEPDEG